LNVPVLQVCCRPSAWPVFFHVCVRVLACAFFARVWCEEVDAV